MSADLVEYRLLVDADEAPAAAMLVRASELHAQRGGARLLPGAARDLVRAARASDPHGAIVGYDQADVAPQAKGAVTDGGRLVSVGFSRRRGEVASVGPIAVSEPGQGLGGAMLDELLSRVEAAGATGVRALLESTGPEAFALFASRAFAPIDTTARLVRGPAPSARIDSARGLEVAAPLPTDGPELAALDARLTGLDRPAILARVTHVARRRGTIAGFLVCTGGLVGPGVALDVADLAGLVARALKDHPGPAVTLASTAAGGPALLALFALGFRILETGTLLSRGVGPPARPPQLYGLDPDPVV